MVSSAQISYPASVDEEVPLQDDARACEVEETPDTRPDDGIGYPDADAGEDECAREEDACPPASIPGGRCYDISPEEFCGDPYEQVRHYDSRQELGKKGEKAAVRYLKSKGYEILKRNWFCRFGEADIIARSDEGVLCFVEVKTRRGIEAGLPEEAITLEKQHRYERIALAYMMVSDEWDDNDNVRFDAIGICVTGPHRALLRHHKGCFNGCL